MEISKIRSNWRAMAVMVAVAVPVIGGMGAIYKYWPELVALAERIAKKEPTCNYGPITVEAGATVNLVCVAKDTTTKQTVIADHSMNRLAPEQTPSQTPGAPNVAKQDGPAAVSFAERAGAFPETTKYPTLFENIREQFALGPIITPRVLVLQEAKISGPSPLVAQKQATRVAVRFVKVLTYEQGDSDDLIPALIKVPCTNTFMPEVCFMPPKNRRNILLRMP
jgi:hypothetical protein